MDELSRRRLEYGNSLVKALLSNNPDQVEKYTELISNLDKMVLEHLNGYWSDIHLKYLKA